jgi:hypothetical protein
MPYKPAQLPPDRQSPDATIPEVMAYRRESARVVWRKIEKGVYRSHKNGDTRLIEWASVIEDRERCVAQGAQLLPPPATGKRSVGRPRKTASDMTWERAVFRTTGHERMGSVWRRWGVSHARGRYVIYLIGRRRLTEFERLAHARRFCESIDGLTDWERPDAELTADSGLGLKLHREALRISGGVRPRLIEIQMEEKKWRRENTKWSGSNRQ